MLQVNSMFEVEKENGEKCNNLINLVNYLTTIDDQHNTNRNRCLAKQMTVMRIIFVN